MTEESLIWYYVIGWVVISVLSALWAGFKSGDLEDRVLSCVLVSTVAMLWPIVLPLAILFYIAKFAKQLVVNKTA